MRILVVEDERQLAGIIGKVLEREHYAVELAFDGDTGNELALSGIYDAIVLDRMLPGMDGLALCRQLRDAGLNTPVLILSARRELDERVEGLDAGADDYLGKPFAFKELLARVRALTRRREREVLPDVLRAGDIALDQQNRRVTLGDQVLVLSPREFALLEYLLRHAGEHRGPLRLLPTA
jgi:DNA-binding response OmpR family regulator